MNRREFFKRFAAVPVAAALAPALVEELLPTRTIFLPPRGGWIEYNEVVTNTFELYGNHVAAHIADNSPIINLIIRRMNEAGAAWEDACARGFWEPEPPRSDGLTVGLATLLS